MQHVGGGDVYGRAYAVGHGHVETIGGHYGHILIRDIVEAYGLTGAVALHVSIAVAAQKRSGYECLFKDKRRHARIRLAVEPMTKRVVVDLGPKPLGVDGKYF